VKDYPYNNVALALLVIIRDFSKSLYAFKQESTDAGLIDDLLKFARYHRGHQHWLRDPMPKALPEGFRIRTTVAARRLIRQILFGNPNSITDEMREAVQSILTGINDTYVETWEIWMLTVFRLMTELSTPPGCSVVLSVMPNRCKCRIHFKKSICMTKSEIDLPLFTGFTYGDLLNSFQEAFNKVKDDIQYLLDNDPSIWPSEQEIAETEKDFVTYIALDVRSRLNSDTEEILSRNKDLFMSQIFKDN
jgi:hypothetical protein